MDCAFGFLRCLSFCHAQHCIVMSDKQSRRGDMELRVFTIRHICGAEAKVIAQTFEAAVKSLGWDIDFCEHVEASPEISAWIVYRGNAA